MFLLEHACHLVVQVVLVLAVFLGVELVYRRFLDHFVVVDVPAEGKDQEVTRETFVVLLLGQFVAGLECVYVRDYDAFYELVRILHDREHAQVELEDDLALGKHEDYPLIKILHKLLPTSILFIP